MRCLIAGSGSEIARHLHTHLLIDGWEVDAVPGHSLKVPSGKWDLLILAHGQMSPIDKFFECNQSEWVGAMMVNCIYPLTCLRAAWPERNEGATVVFIGGPNMVRTTPTYTAYRAGKAVLEALTGTLEAEYPGFHFKVLHPGVVKTRIHQQTLQAGHRASNYERVMRIVNGSEPSTGHDEVYMKLKALL